MLTRFKLTPVAVLIGAITTFGQTAKSANAVKHPLAVGSPAPALTVDKWIKGSPIARFEKGKIYVVEFWATWCVPCKASMPHLSKLQHDFGPNGVTIIGVASQDPHDSLEVVEATVKDKGDTIDYAIAWDPERKIYETFMTPAGQDGIPSAFVIDGTSGMLLYVGDPNYLELPLQGLIGGTWDVEKAKVVTADVNARGDEVFRLIRKDPKEMLAKLDAFEEKYPEVAHPFDIYKFGALVDTGDSAAASKFGLKLVDDAIKAKDAQLLNRFAWSIVDPEAKTAKRDLGLALRAAEGGVSLTHEKNGELLATLARVYFTQGEVKKAIDVQTKSVAVSDGNVKKEQQNTLDQYKSSSK